jgi:isoleucyl-tRNA synthetase
MGRLEKLTPKRPVNDADNAVLQYWRDNDIPTKEHHRARGQIPEWIFYEVRLRQNGRPGIHHVLSRMLKDDALPLQDHAGLSVRRKAGWDTHGLPSSLRWKRNSGFRPQPENRGVRHRRVQQAVPRVGLQLPQGLRNSPSVSLLDRHGPSHT